MIELRGLGAAEIRTPSATLTPSQEIVFATALYLVLERGRRVSRAALARLIWPSISTKERAHRLRQTILQLKKLGVPLTATRDVISLDKSTVDSDVDLASNRAHERNSEARLDFMPGYEPGFSGPFAEWFAAKRTEFESAVVAILIPQLDLARVHGNWQRVEQIAAQCLAIDEFNEEAVLAQAEAAAMRGSKRKAVSILDRYLTELGESAHDLRIPAKVLRRRVIERIPDRPALLNADPAFVGRESEMADLTAAFEHARASRGSATLILGEPGIGKSRLSAELTRFAELRGARVQKASCRRADIDRPLSLFVDIVPQLREMPGALGCSPETFAWLKRLTEYVQGTENSPRSRDAEVLFENIRAALFDLLDSITEEHCVVILIEDLQWLDAGSAKILVRMIEWSQNRRVLILLNSRPGQHAFLEYAEKVPMQTLALGPLATESATALLRSIALRPGDEPQTGFINWCLAVAEGNPFFLQELAHQWIETGHRYEAPPSVSKVIDERLSRLSSEALQVLQTCAVLSDHATIDRVERLLEYHPHQLLAAIEELSRSAMLRAPADGSEKNEPQIEPRHDFLATAATKRLAPVSLAFLHRRSAEVLETDLGSQPGSATLLWACATHRHHAGDRVKALALKMSCAEHLLELGLPHDARAAYQQTMDSCVTDTERLRVLSGLARASELAGEWQETIEKLQLCASLAATIDPAQSQHNDYELSLQNARHRSAMDFVALLDETLICVSSDSASRRHRVGAAVLALKLACDFGRADYLDAIYAQVSPFLGCADVGELECLQIEVIYRTMRSDTLVPISDLNQLAVTGRRVGGELGYSQGLLMGATACRLSGRYEEGLHFASKALEHARAHRLHARCRQAVLQTVGLHIAAGALGKARRALAEVGEYAFPSDDLKESYEVHTLDTRIALEEGDLARAVQAFHLVGVQSPNYSVARQGFHLALELQIRLKEGASCDVLRAVVNDLDTAHMQLRGIGSQDFECYSLYLGLCALGRPEDGVRRIREYVERRRIKWPLPKPMLEVLAAQTSKTEAVGAFPRRKDKHAVAKPDLLSGIG